MSAKRGFQILAVTLVVVLILTIQAGFATTQLAAAATNSSACARPAIHLSSLQAVFDQKLGMFVARTSAGPAGVDGGLLSLLGTRSCWN